jgi:hypothetical protein
MINQLEIIFGSEKTLTKQAYTVAIGYLQYIKSLNFIDNSRINLIISDGEPNEFTITGINDKVCNIYTKINIAEYSLKNEIEKKKYLFSLITNSMIFLSNQKGWDEKIFQEIVLEIIGKNYSTPIKYIPIKTNKSKDLKAEVIVNMCFDYADFALCLYDMKGNHIKSISFWKAFPSLLLCSRFFHFARWLEKDVYEIADTENEIRFLIDINSSEVKVEFHPHGNSIDELKNLLRGLDHRTPEEERMKLLGLQN